MSRSRRPLVAACASALAVALAVATPELAAHAVTGAAVTLSPAWSATVTPGPTTAVVDYARGATLVDPAGPDGVLTATLTRSTACGIEEVVDTRSVAVSGTGTTSVAANVTAAAGGTLRLRFEASDGGPTGVTESTVIASEPASADTAPDVGFVPGGTVGSGTVELTGDARTKLFDVQLFVDGVAFEPSSVVESCVTTSVPFTGLHPGQVLEVRSPSLDLQLASYVVPSAPPPAPTVAAAPGPSRAPRLAETGLQFGVLPWLATGLAAAGLLLVLLRRRAPSRAERNPS